MGEQGLRSVFTALRQAREQRDISLQDAAQAVNIPLHYLQTLETGEDSRVLADPMYLIPFLRRYAAFLDLNPDEAVRQFLAEPRKSGGARINNLSTNPVRPVRFSGWLVPLVVLVGGLVVGAFLLQSSDLRLWWTGSTEPPVAADPAEAGLLPDEGAPLTAPPVAERGQDAADMIEPPVAADPAEASPPPGEETPGAAPPVPEEEQVVDISPTPEPALPSTLPALAPSAPSPEAPQLPRAPSGFHQLHIQARERTWIRVVIDEELIQDVVLEPNEQVRWEARDNFTLTVGNAGGVEVTFDDDRLPPLGQSGEVIRQLHLPASEDE
ncbi:MAG: DUF4115 domain-containing protein [Desulfurellaceae bacterium]|nr:DUF4115 domain-containing protein [Desulfurellaceae bacterium]